METFIEMLRHALVTKLLLVYGLTFQILALMWLVLVMQILLLLGTRLPTIRVNSPPLRVLLSMLLGPCVLIFWASVMFNRSTTGRGWVIVLHHMLGLMSLLWIVKVVVKARHVRLRWILVLHALSAVAMTVAAWFIGAMAVTNDWL